MMIILLNAVTRQAALGIRCTTNLPMLDLKKFYVENSVKSRIEGSAEINIHDTNEIAEAAWLTREEIHKKYNGVSITNEMVARVNLTRLKSRAS